MTNPATQRIVKVRRDYNTWVANEMLEDYALRYTPRSFRRWSEFRLANTALGATSFLALEAISGAITLSYGFTNTFWAIACVVVLFFLTGLPISYYAARYGVDMDLLTRGAGFGYIGSTVTSLIYASFTFIFFALEAAIMAQAIEIYFGLPLVYGYVLCSLIIIPMVAYGITLINRLQMWTQPLWIVLLALPYICVLYKEPEALANLLTFAGRAEDGSSFNILLFGAAATVAFSLIAQIGEQVDFLRFLPEKTAANRGRWWTALLLAGPGWILLGGAKMLGGALLAFLAIQHEVPMAKAVEPTQMYLIGYQYVFSNPALALGAVVLFVVVSQIKINVTNAYAGSLAWSNFFARVTHSHPGRVVWLVFNVLIAVLLMELGVFNALEHVLALYSLVAISWIGAVVSDLVINKPLKLSPAHIEFKRAHLYDVNPVGVGAMAIASLLSAIAMSGVLGKLAAAMAPFIALGTALLCAPLIAVATRSRYYIARRDTLSDHSHAQGQLDCVICGNRFETPDMAYCPAYQGSICSLCCSLDARCNDRCKAPAARLPNQIFQTLRSLVPARFTLKLNTRISHYLIVFGTLAGGLAVILWMLYFQQMADSSGLATAGPASIKSIFVKLFCMLLVLLGVGSWWLVLTNESRAVAQEESERQTNLLLQEIEAHKQTDAELQRAKEAAESANLAKSRFVAGMSHELRTPLNSILGYAQILHVDATIPPARKDAIAVIRRSGEHLLSLIDGLLDIAKIEAGKMRLASDEVALAGLLEQITGMFAPQAEQKGLAFSFEKIGRIPHIVHADQKRLRQILINLLGNAVKFTDRGSVTVRVHYMREIAYFDIIDTGIGIADDDLERIFLPFERSNAANLREDIGTGLGLAISRMLTHIMGGELSVKSEVGRGSSFHLKIYLPEVHVPRPRLQLEDQMTGYAGPARRVLVVDDQASQRRLLKEMLLPLGFEVAEADSGIACMEALARRVPDLVLLDIAMPLMDGWSVARAIRARGLAQLPVILVSADAFENLHERSDPPLYDDFVVKPVSYNELLAKIRQHLRLEWVAPPPAAAAATTAPAQPVMLVPPRHKLQALLELGAIGYAKGILHQLDELERHTPAYLPFTTDLRQLVRQFRLNEYVTRIEELIRHDLNDVR
ncbi:MULTISPECIES: ATP-binding protein [unclassified Herbaspirillum]|uniref:ATP-binding protein n=1 Tax=unclassified Herbaspirillum TaxID=2624150 RepID=UPI001150BC70|nr:MULTISPECIES: ATP-binding protein [unclassified Herbaspirillum]MBB5393418.1 signal transduction histidine kinase/CheY-like chemotaxis protein/purine-cytosine permease-like protein [Herbaspirillum sp. SJZ102]TQK03834.1 signal transduction histidine kinase [Herbaspirillum sp. SJZ130]TQK08566.1 signal transduction histidine kinase [Herbaspirillum sp. SJZ106]